MPFDEVNGRLQRVVGSQVQRIAISTGADRRKRDAAALQFDRQSQTGTICRRQFDRFILSTTSPDGANGVKNIFCRQIAGRGSDGAACRTALGKTTLRIPHDCRSANAMNGPIDAASARKLTVGRIHDRVHVLLSDVALNQFQLTISDIDDHEFEQ